MGYSINESARRCAVKSLERRDVRQSSALENVMFNFHSVFLFLFYAGKENGFRILLIIKKKIFSVVSFNFYFMLVQTKSKISENDVLIVWNNKAF